MSRKFITPVLGALVMVALSATAFAQPHAAPLVIKSKSVVKTIPLRDMQWQLPPIMQRIVGNQHFSQANLARLRQKLVKSGLLEPAGSHHVIPLLRKTPALQAAPTVRDSVLQSAFPTRQPRNFTTPMANFDGQGASAGDSIYCAPPDTNMATGMNYVVQEVNCAGTGSSTVAVYDKTGNLILGPAPLASLWGSGVCATNPYGDGVVVYDQLAQRWVISQFAGSSVPTDECVAVSQTSDPTGSYYAYDFSVFPGQFADYPKISVWPDAYYASFNVFNGSGTAFDGAGFVAFERSAMLNGTSAQEVIFQGNGADLAYSVLPADLDGLTSPPAGTPGIFVDYVSPYLWGTSYYALEMWQLKVDWTTPSNSTLTGPTEIDVAAFNDGICGGSRSCIPQPSPGEGVDALGDRLMFRLAYRNGVGSDGHQTLVVNQTVGTGGAPSSVPSGIRWYELDAPAGATSASSWSVAQQGTYMPADGMSRWMGSVAMDHSGNMALGYSDSSSSVNPGVAYTGRLASDPSGTMTQSETTLVTGGGVQESTYNRWGDYSSMVIDPSDDCTFWYTQEYYATSGSFNWSTRIGAFKFANCTQGPTGTLSGTVTDASSHAPIANATITIQPGGITTETASNGTYSVVLPVGSYTATVSDFGYEPGSASVTISDGVTTTQDFALTPAPSATISGNVTDGSGHGYGLYAEIKITTAGFGQVADLWTDPTTGSYSVNLPIGNDYTMDVHAVALNGYNPATATVTLSGNLTQNFALTVDAGCTAPGYHFTGGLSEGFDEATFPPSGWTVTNDYAGSDVVWRSSPNWYDGNYTPQSQPPATDLAATADSNNAGIYEGYYGSYDTSLVTPPIPVTSLGGTTLQYDASYNALFSTLDLDISTDGGTTWTNVTEWGPFTSQGTLYGWPGAHQVVDLSPYLPGSGTFQLRWRYYDLTGGFDWYIQIDKVLLGAACTPISGGLVLGQVTDANTNQGLVGAKVQDDTGAGATTVSNPADPNLPVGVYLYFTTSGTRTVTASDTGYTPQSAQVAMTDSAVVTQNFALKAGRLATNPSQFTLHVMVNNTATRGFALSNTGDGDATFNILPINSPPPSQGTINGGRGAPLHHVNGHFSPLSLMAQPHHTKRGPSKIGPRDPGPRDAPWLDIANFPEPIMDNCAAADSAGDVYSFDGYNGGANVADVYEYDPTTDTWSQMASNPTAVEAPACAFINGKFYLADGWDATTGATTAALQIYDPIANSWTTGTDNPAPLGGGVKAVALNGMMYLIGGCDSSTCGYTTVEVYNPATDSWSSAADYPHQVSWEACGTINGKIYCAGGSAASEYADGYVYDPTTDSWSPIASIPVSSGGLWGSGSIAALGHLLISGGVTANFTQVTNEGFSYDPGSDTWSALPNSNNTLYRGGSACGFYKIGGSTGGFAPVPNSEYLAGNTPCGKPPSIPWLTVAPLKGTITDGASTNIALTFDGTGQAEFTTSQAYLAVTNDTPYGTPIVPLTVTWDPQPIHLILTGVPSPNPVQKGGNLVYNMTIENQQLTNHGAATQTSMSYVLPSGVKYIAYSGDANSCTPAPSGTSPAPAPATIICDFGTIDLGASKNEAIALQVNNAGTLLSTFSVKAREPDSDPSTNTTTVSTTVTGTSDLSASSQNASVPIGSSGVFDMQVMNAGPDTATNVAFKVSSSENVKLLSAHWTMTSGGVGVSGDCLPISGSNALNCDLPDVPNGATVDFQVDGFGAYAGSATVIGQVTTSATDPQPNNNVTSATITVTSSSHSGAAGGGGGGALGWLALVALLGLGLTGAWTRRRRA